MKRIFTFLAILLLIIPSVSFANEVKGNENVIDINQYVAENQELPDVELSNNIKSFEFEENKIVEMDSVFFDDLISIEVDESIIEESSVETTAASGSILPKTITKIYSSTNFPPTVTYTEYNRGFWFKGDLTFKSAERTSDGRYKATYSGVLILQPQ